MATRVETLKTNGIVEEHVQGNFAVEVGGVVVEKEDVAVGEGEAKLGQAVVESGLEEGAHKAMLKLVSGVTTTKGATLFFKPKSSISAPLIEDRLKMIHHKTGFGITSKFLVPSNHRFDPARDD